jgi:hypothetical protein
LRIIARRRRALPARQTTWGDWSIHHGELAAADDSNGAWFDFYEFDAGLNIVRGLHCDLPAGTDLVRMLGDAVNVGVSVDVSMPECSMYVFEASTGDRYGEGFSGEVVIDLRSGGATRTGDEHRTGSFRDSANDPVDLVYSCRSSSLEFLSALDGEIAGWQLDRIGSDGYASHQSCTENLRSPNNPQ